MLKFTLLFLCLALCACDKPDPNPELKDHIYQDYQTEMGITEKNLADFKKQLEGFEKDLSKVVPQTGREKRAKKQIWETEGRITVAEQQKKYWILRIEDRRDFVRRKSIEAFQKHKPLDLAAEWTEYSIEKKMRHAKLNWNAKDRRKEFLDANGLTPAPKVAEGEGKSKE